MKQVAQLTLKVQLPDDETFDNYKSDDNLAIVSQLKSYIDQQQDSPHSFYLFGSSSVGKSHLLHASSTYAAHVGKSSVCLSCAELKRLPVEVLDGLEQMDLICLDDIHLIAGDERWQQAIFDLYNRVFEQNNYLLITGDESAQQLGISLPDLVSRLSWGLTEQVKPLDDEEKIIAIQHRATQRGLFLSDDVVKFLLNRLSRDMGSLISSLDVLDKASIQEQRKITIPFIKQVLNLK
ncbi:DnaA regulatory inactivator Hda [Colwellia sp. MT41]|uniref:DnaA regulatory inactivator Hda n=1 Tax=Colwellia marinimaniae TaxID=1513592 RepID=A0ABQ0MYS4_9GAMM|nr:MULTISPECIES: DnaA regulatory inactivator Hda [Colwellia]ALO34451.1 DnaA regulatory inactivator Hda [Colwellia sp. MT41]GAW97521.1 DnaA regulatory inactivator Hda [Colwellia marinimaniae]